MPPEPGRRRWISLACAPRESRAPCPIKGERLEPRARPNPSRLRLAPLRAALPLRRRWPLPSPPPPRSAASDARRNQPRMPGAPRRRAASPAPVPVASRAPERCPCLETETPAAQAPPLFVFRLPLHAPAAGEPSIEIPFGSSPFSPSYSSSSPSRSPAPPSLSGRQRAPVSALFESKGRKRPVLHEIP
jgi:hypothetical protein